MTYDSNWPGRNRYVDGERAKLNLPGTSSVFALTLTQTGGNYAQVGCHQANSVTIVSNSALSRSSVTIHASHDVFVDPCTGVLKRLAVSLGVSMRRPDAVTDLQHTLDGHRVRWRIAGSSARSRTIEPLEIFYRFVGDLAYLRHMVVTIGYSWTSIVSVRARNRLLEES
jgi:hypothetical protein